MSDQTVRDLIAGVLVTHQRRSSDSCLCGWAVLGASHSQHQADAVLAALAAAGLTITDTRAVNRLAERWDHTAAGKQIRELVDSGLTITDTPTDGALMYSAIVSKARELAARHSSDAEEFWVDYVSQARTVLEAERLAKQEAPRD